MNYFVDLNIQSVKVRPVPAMMLLERMVLPSHDCVALVVKLVDTRDLKSLDFRVVPVQVRPGAPSIRYHPLRRVGRVAMQRIANPWTSVRLRDAPPFATLAQLVERNLAKVEVTSSNLVCRSKQRKPDQKWSGFLLSGTCEEGEPRAQAGRVAPNKESPIRNGRAFCYLAHAKRENLVPKLVASFQTRKARSEMVGLFAIWHLLSDMAFSALQLYGLRR